MDSTNRFHTNNTWLWTRAEYVALMLASIVLVVIHLDEVRWYPFIVAFSIIDILGYLPGAIVYRRRGGGKIPPVYHHLYNVTHSFLTGGAAIGLWALIAGRLEWAMLSIPIHYLGDRGLFGNVYKPAELSFEPAPRK